MLLIHQRSESQSSHRNNEADHGKRSSHVASVVWCALFIHRVHTEFFQPNQNALAGCDYNGVVGGMVMVR